MQLSASFATLREEQRSRHKIKPPKRSTEHGCRHQDIGVWQIYISYRSCRCALHTCRVGCVGKHPGLHCRWHWEDLCLCARVCIVCVCLCAYVPVCVWGWRESGDRWLRSAYMHVLLYGLWETCEYVYVCVLLRISSINSQSRQVLTSVLTLNSLLILTNNSPMHALVPFLIPNIQVQKSNGPGNKKNGTLCTYFAST